MEKKDCLVCCEGIEALEEKLIRDDYIRLEDLSLCDTCRGMLLASIENKTMEESEGEERDEQES